MPETLIENRFVEAGSTHLVLPLADGALHPQHQLLRRLRLLPQDRLRLATKPLLLPIVPVIIFVSGQSQTRISWDVGVLCHMIIDL